MEKKKVLILSAPLGMGHVKVAEALKEALCEGNSCEVTSASILDFTSKIFRVSLPRLYDLTSEYFPAGYRWAYHYYNDSKKQKIIHEIPKIFLQSKFLQWLRALNPDCIISTHPLPLQLVTLTKERRIINILSANVCTDFGYHSIWLNADVNYYFVANAEIQEKLILNGVKSNQVFVTGIPIAKKFSEPQNRQELSRKIQLDPKIPTLLFIGGLLKKNEIEGVYERISKKMPSVQCIVVSGRDKKLEHELHSSFLQKENSVRIFGFSNVLHELMAASDLVISKTGGSTVAECLALELPMLAYKVIPGQEEENLSYILRNGAGVRAETLNDISARVLEIFAENKKLEALKNACRILRKPLAARMVAENILRIIRAWNPSQK